MKMSTAAPDSICLASAELAANEYFTVMGLVFVYSGPMDCRTSVSETAANTVRVGWSASAAPAAVPLSHSKVASSHVPISRMENPLDEPLPAIVHSELTGGYVARHA